MATQSGKNQRSGGVSNLMNCTPQSVCVLPSEAVPSSETAIEWLEINADAYGAAVGISHFTGAGGTGECHVTVALSIEFPDPTTALELAWLAALAAADISPASTVMRRVFCSDVINQTPQLQNFSNTTQGAFSTIGQTPLAGGKLALWSQHIIDPEAPLESIGGGACFSLTRGSLCHCWISGLCAAGHDDAFSETAAILGKHKQWLTDHDMTLAENVVRTWWFIRNIDENYQGMVDARREFFAEHGLTKSAHYIASTGIAGTHRDPSSRLSLDSHSIAGLKPTQIEYLSAPEHLGPTHAYGVTFERATAISYADRRHIIISGTASIDAAGKIVHPGDILGQLDRTLENISALLAAAEASLDDLAMILVYLRDPEDGKQIEDLLKRRFGKLPMIILHAPVCRPGWLIEIEGVAIVASSAPELPYF